MRWTMAKAAVVTGGAALALAGASLRPATGPAEDARGAARVIPAGTEFDVALAGALGTETSSIGDRWSATLAAPIADEQGVVLVASGAVTGRITEAGPVEVENETVQVLTVEPKELRVNGRRFPMRAEVIAAGVDERADAFAGQDIALVGAGAGGGTGFAAHLGEEGEALVAAVLGAAAGTVVAVAPRGTAIELPEGTMLRLRLLEDVGLKL